MSPVNIFKRSVCLLLIAFMLCYSMPMDALAQGINEYRLSLRENDNVVSDPAELPAENDSIEAPAEEANPTPAVGPTFEEEPQESTTADADYATFSSAATLSESGDYTYDVINDTCAKITAYIGTDTKVVIPETIDGYTVTVIGKNAFSGNGTLTSVTFPDTLTEIQCYAFYKCTSLESVVIPDSVTTLSTFCFAENPNLSSVTLSKNWTYTTNYYNNITSSGFQGPFYKCASLTSIEIPEGATVVPANAFNGCTSLKSVSIPSTVTTINMYAFYGTGITEITIPSSVTALGVNCFDSCTCLTSIVIPESITTIPKYAFSGCTSLASITLPDTLTVIQAYAFQKCTSLESVVIPDSVTVLGTMSFASNPKLSSVTLSKNWNAVYNIYNNASDDINLVSPFYDCAALTSIAIPEGMVTIPNNAFSNCTALTSVTIPSTVTTISRYAFLKSGITEITIPSSVTALGVNCFDSCSNLTSVVIPESITTISKYAFSGCISLTSVTLPDTLTEIQCYAFYKCTSLESVVIPDSVTTLSTYCFASNPKLSSVTLSKNWTYTTNYNNIVYNSGFQSPFYDCAALTSIVIPEGATVVPANAFNGCTSLKSVSIPSTVTAINMYAFYGTGITEITIPSSVTALDVNCFDCCSNLTSIVIPESITTIPKYAFSGCISLTSVTLPDTLTVIQAYAFQKCTSLESVVIPDSVTVLGTMSFASNPKLSSVTLSKNWNAVYNINNIDYYNVDILSPFYDCAALTSIAIPEGATEIPRNAFAGCASLRSVSIPSTVTTIRSFAFYSAGISGISIPSSVTSLGDSCFSKCTRLTSIILPIGVEDIPNYAFYGCTSLANVNAPATVKTIGSCAFENCTALKYVNFSSDLKTIGANAFRGCTVLERVTIPSPNTTIADGAFTNCTALTLYCKYLSLAFVYAYTNEIPYTLLDVDPADYANYAIDMSATNFYSTRTSSASNAAIPFTLNYSVLESERDQISNKKIVLTFLSNVDLVSGSVTVNGKVQYSVLSNNKLTLSVSENEGTITFYVVPTEGGLVSALAQFVYTKDGSSVSEAFAFASIDSPLLTMDSQSFITSTTFNVSGFAQRSEKLTFYINDTLAGSTTALKDGTYSASLSFPFEAVDGTRYTITVKNSDGSSEVSRDLKYSSNEPRLTGFMLYYTAHSTQQLDLLNTEGEVLTNMINPSKPLKFVITFDNYEDLGQVFVISTRNGVDKRMNATPTGNPGEYVAEGFFDSNHTYVPGSVHVGYTTIYTVEDRANDVENSELADKWRNATVVEDEEYCTDDSYKATITLEDGTVAEVESYDDLTIDDVRALLLGEPAQEVEPASARDASFLTVEKVLEMYKVLVDDLNDEYVDNAVSNVSDVAAENLGESVTVVRTAPETFAYVFFNPLKKTFTTVFTKAVFAYGLNEYAAPAMAYKDCYTAVGTVASAGKIVIKAYEWSNELSEAENSITNSTTLSADDKQYALKQLDTLRWGYVADGVLRLAALAAPAILKGTGHPVAAALTGVVLKMAANLLEDYLDDATAYYLAGGKGSYLKWLIDPSGYVYDLATGEKLAGVTATIYGIEYDGKNDDYETFFATPPADDEYGTVWDAAEYNQLNPQITEADGEYAWDTTEGWWRIKFEKAGYKTAWSEWLSVPPVQTDINIGLESSLGDVNGDGAINIKDLVLLCRYIVGKIDSSSVVVDNCYIDAHEGITVSDAIALARILRAA